MQEHFQHLFSTVDEVDGRSMVDERRLKEFAAFLRDAIDRDGDGTISKDEFVRGYCIWQMHISKAEQRSQKNLLAADVYA